MPCPLCGSVPFVLNRRVYTPEVIDLGYGLFQCSADKTIWQDPILTNYPIPRKITVNES